MGNYGLRKRFRNLGNRRGGDVNVMINGANRVNVDVNGGWRRRGGRSLNTILDRFGGDVLVNGQRFTSAAFNEAARLSNLFYNTQSS
jgi:hypothetical protein